MHKWRQEARGIAVAQRRKQRLAYLRRIGPQMGRPGPLTTMMKQSAAAAAAANSGTRAPFALPGPAPHHIAPGKLAAALAASTLGPTSDSGAPTSRLSSSVDAVAAAAAASSALDIELQLQQQLADPASTISILPDPVVAAHAAAAVIINKSDIDA